MVQTTRREPVRSPLLLVTKLHPPVSREQTVARERLVRLLRPGPGVKLTVVAAPAGSGKTTLLGMWRDAESAARPVAWLTLDEGDNDPVVLWSHLLEALRRVNPEIGRSVPAPGNASRAVDVVVRELVNDLAEREDVVLILDDFHRLSSGAARDSIAWLIEYAPASFHLILGTRSEPGLPLGAMRAHGELLELRADELGFTPDEADALLNGRLDLGLERADIDLLVGRIEGWAAGVYLAGLSLAGVRDRHAFVSGFDGSSRLVVDFLGNEVLDTHDPETQALMLRSSILDRLSGPLCDAVVESQDSTQRLTQLAQTNLFLLPLDNNGEWYRFHHLFAQLLRVELEHREPGATQTLHRRAYAWYRSQGFVDEAVRHAQRAGAYAEAVELIAEVWLKTASAGRHSTVLTWLDGFPQGLSRSDPSLLLMRAWMSSLAGDRETAAAAIALLEGTAWPDDRPLPDGTGSLEASLATLRAGFSWGDLESAYTNAERALELVPKDSPLRSEASWSLAIAQYFGGEFDAADRRFDETVQRGLRDERWLVVASALAYRSLIAGEREQLEEQLLLADEAAEVARERGLQEIRGEVHVAAGVALATQGELEDALPCLERGVALLRSGQPLDFALALLHQARVQQATGRRAAAATTIAEAATTIESCPDAGILSRRLVERERATVTDPRDSDLSGRELVVLRMLKGSLSERDIGRELYLSHNTIHSHTKSIYRKLGASSRHEAIRVARTLALI
jgi:LuxR family maltose regulon positive regulatory protein